MNMLTSIKNRLHIGREIPKEKNSETGAKIDTEDKISLSSGSGEDKNSMTLKDLVISGGYRKEPQITQKESKALKLISKKAFRENCISKESIGTPIMIAIGGILPALLLAPTIPIGLGMLGVGMIAGSAISSTSSGNASSAEARMIWREEFENKSEADSMVELQSKHPDIWTEMMKDN